MSSKLGSLPLCFCAMSFSATPNSAAHNLPSGSSVSAFECQTKPSILSARQYKPFFKKSATPPPPLGRGATSVERPRWSDPGGATAVQDSSSTGQGPYETKIIVAKSRRAEEIDGIVWHQEIILGSIQPQDSQHGCFRNSKGLLWLLRLADGCSGCGGWEGGGG